MAVIKELAIHTYDRGSHDVYYKEIELEVPVGQMSDVIKVALKDTVDVFIENCDLEKSISYKSKILDDTADWKTISDSQYNFSLDPGFYYLRITNTSDTETAKIIVSGI